MVLNSAVDFLLQSVTLILEVLHKFILLGADIGQREYFIVKRSQIELVLQGHGGSVLLDILIHQLFAGKCVLNKSHQLLGLFVLHEKPTFR
jgi:hypothetical protein